MYSGDEVDSVRDIVQHIKVTDPFTPFYLQSTIHDNLLTSMRTVINGMAKLSITLANSGNEVRRELGVSHLVQH